MTSNKYAFYSKTKKVFLSIFLIVQLGFSIAVSAEKNTIDVKPFQDKLLGQWVYIESGYVKGMIEFIDKEHVFISPALIDYKSHGYDFKGDDPVLARWFIKPGNVSNKLGNSYTDKKGRLIYRKNSHIIVPSVQFINMQVSKYDQKTAKLFHKPHPFLITEPEMGKLYLSKPRNMFVTASKNEDLKELINIKTLKKSNPELAASWKKRRYQKLQSLNQGIYNTCNDTWKFRESAFKECLKFSEIYSKAGFNVYKPEVFDRQVTPVNKFLLDPVRDYSDSKPVPTRLCQSTMTANTPEGLIELKRKLETQGFVDTLWLFNVTPAIPQPEKNVAETNKFFKAFVIWANISKNAGTINYSNQRQKIIHLRSDGVIGLTWDKTDRVVTNPPHAWLERGGDSQMVYDPANRWSYDGKYIKFNWQDGLSQYKFEAKNPAMLRARYENARISLIYSERYLSVTISQIYFTRQNRAKLNTVYNSDCNTKQNSQPAIQKESSPITSTKNKPAAKSQTTLSGSAWHVSIVPVDPNMAIDANIKALWARGAYIHLRQGGQMGFNWNTPTDYAYDAKNRWSVQGNQLSIDFSGTSYTFDKASNDSRLVAVDNNNGILRMTMQPKFPGQK